MNSTECSEEILKVKDLKVHFYLDHYYDKGLRDVFVSALSNPFEYFFKQKEIFYALNGLTFTLHRGMRLGILGVNGSGKTTLCRCLAGMMRAQEGSVETTKEVRAIFDTGSGIMPELTGRENAQLLARLFFTGEKEVKHLVEEAISFSELGHFIDAPFKKYSKGMQSRLLLSLISSLPADILILDEVFDGADVFFRQKLAKRMISFIEKAGATVFVSHSTEQIREICNKVMVIHEGKMHFLGEVEDGIKAYMGLNPETR
jgi:ABC-type polysaccharide/polyol phosphate transport system ATPase subunit